MRQTCVSLAALVATLLSAAPAAAAPALSDPCYWFLVHWAEMTPTQQELMGRLGWSAKNWDSVDTADDPANETALWSELTAEERQINEQLGMTEERWDHPPENCQSF